ncbi:PulJ/GspJ family protein [Anaerosporobacter sp.]
MKKIDNRGVTLVELIIVMALAAIVSLMAFSFLQDSTHYYNRVSAEVDIQMEAQTTYNQIRDFVMSAEAGVMAFGMDKSPAEKKLNLDGKEYRALVIYGRDKIKAVIYNPSNKKLYLVEDARIDDDKKADPMHIIECIKKIGDVNLMSEGVSEFDIPNADKIGNLGFNGIVQMKLEFTKKDRSKVYESNVTMRNGNVVFDRGN